MSGFIRVSSMALLIAATIGGCNRDTDTSPPNIHYAQQECDACRMIVSEDRFAAALVLSGEREVRKLVFDDVNCLIQHMSKEPLAANSHAYVHDFETKTWIVASSATFVRSAKLHTPMASQVIASSSRQSAETLLKDYPGSILSWNEVQALFSPRHPAAAASTEASKP